MWYWIAVAVAVGFFISTAVQIFAPSPLRWIGVIETVIIGVVWWFWSFPAAAIASVVLFYFGQPLALAIVALVSTLLESLKPKSPPALPPSRIFEKDIVKACLAVRSTQ